LQYQYVICNFAQILLRLSSAGKYGSICDPIYQELNMFKTNEYFDGKVKSIAFQGQEKPATVGVMATGEYVFNTAAKEKMTVITGELIIQLDGDSNSHTYKPGQSFVVDANSAFNVKVPADCAYLCEYG
jgi:purine/pyrimidine-nucleoside phosphorylase